MAMGQYDPAKEPCEPLYQDLHYGSCDSQHMFCIHGPGGNNTLTENNEKGILETDLFSAIRSERFAALGSDHDSNRMGIYATNSVGDND